MRIVVGKFCEPNSFNRLHRALVALALRDALKFQCNLDVVENGVPREQGVVLEHEGNFLGGRPG